MDILAIDDDHLMLHTISMVLEDAFGEILTLEHPNAALSRLETSDIKVILLDLNFAIGDSDGAEGLAWIKKLKEIKPHLSIIVLTAHGFLDIAVQSLKQGATDFLEKPFSNEKLVATVQAGLNLAKTQQDLAGVRSNRDLLIHQANQSGSMVIGQSKAMQQVMHMISKVANTEASVLITGPHGTGKEVLARLIHQQSARAAQPFINADLSAISSGLFESTLFGHIQGAFTDASEDKQGLMEGANLGTLLLDEIGSLPLVLQTKMLSALQNRAVSRVGDHRPRAIDIRLISTTHKTLEELNDINQFRQDLLFRINTVHIELPPLRNRKEDIKPLVEHFLAHFNKKYARIFKLDKAQLKSLEDYHWPGNIRELKNTIERMVIMDSDDSFKGADASQKKADNLYEVEKLKIVEVMERHAGNITHAANELGIGRNTLYRKLKKYDL
ncbi:sigma-54-dependent transcriptional regulator [Roseivirga sp.]|uniref:sigma-54-dependent transcriptional regulator n=1 Tax=Roseivirga sp. TaxID=1964215 RepID=UPI003B8E8FED